MHIHAFPTHLIQRFQLISSWIILQHIPFGNRRLAKGPMGRADKRFQGQYDYGDNLICSDS